MITIKAPFKHSYKVNSVDSVPLSVYNVGFQKCEPLHQWGSGVRDHFLIHHVVSGKGYYTVNNKTYPIYSGSTFIVFPNTQVTYQADEENPWEYYWVGFAGSNAKTILDHTDFSWENPIITTSLGSDFKKNLLKIYKSRGNMYSDTIKMTGYLHIALSILIKNSTVTNKSFDPSIAYAKKAHEYIAYNFSTQITVETVANYVGISRSHLYRVFMQHYSVSPKTYLSTYRINEACRLIKTTNLPIGVIANSVGFEDHLYFSKAFHKIKGLTPTAYSKKKTV